MAMEPHTKIINAAAKQILAPHGFFQKGRSRIWLQDNGWFLTVVEFQPSSFSKGTFLNVAMHFLWQKPITGEEPFISLDHGSRVRPPDVPMQLVAYTGDDDAFAQQVEVMAHAAVRNAAGYKRCTDLAYAKKLICAGELIDYGWGEYDRAMLCFLAGDVEEGLRHLKHFSATHQNSEAYWSRGLWKICEQEIPERCKTPDSARQMVLDMIQTTRAAYLALPSFKGMNKEPYNG